MKILLLMVVLLAPYASNAQNPQSPAALEGTFAPSTNLIPRAVSDMWIIDVRYAEQLELLKSLRAKRYICERKTEAFYACRFQKRITVLPPEIQNLLLSKIDSKKNIVFATASGQDGALIHKSQNFEVWGFGNQVTWNGMRLAGYQIQVTPDSMKLALYSEARKFLDDFIIPTTPNTLLKFVSARKFESQNHWQEYHAFSVWPRVRR